MYFTAIYIPRPLIYIHTVAGSPHRVMDRTGTVPCTVFLICADRVQRRASSVASATRVLVHGGALLGASQYFKTLRVFGACVLAVVVGANA